MPVESNKRCRGVSQVMEADAWQLRTSQYCHERIAAEVAAAKRPAALIAEHPGYVGAAFCDHRLAVATQGFDGDLGKMDAATALLGLRLTEFLFAIDLNERVANLDGTLLQIDVRRWSSQDLSLSHPRGHSEYIGGLHATWRKNDISGG
jgi:hypothetical protein